MLPVLLTFAASMSAVGLAAAEAPRDLLQHYECSRCHADTGIKRGPSYVDIAARYAGKRQAATKVAAFIRKGDPGGGRWHIQPHPEVSAVDAEKMAQYILAHKKKG